MRLAIISDIHGNYKALEAFLAYIEVHPVDGIVCLGDYLSWYAGACEGQYGSGCRA